MLAAVAPGAHLPIAGDEAGWVSGQVTLADGFKTLRI
jgi:hypothetical protein